MVFRSVDAWVMITIFPVIVVMSGVTRGDQYPTLISPPARWVTNCSPQAWSIRLLSQSLIQRSNFPKLLQMSNQLEWLCGISPGDMCCLSDKTDLSHFYDNFILFYDVIWYHCQALYCRLLCRAARCHGTAGAVVLLMWSCCGEVLWRVGMWHQTPLRLGHDKNPRIQNLELSAPARALGSWTSLSSSFSSLSLFSSSLTSKLNEVSKKKTILNVQMRCRRPEFPTFVQSEVIKWVTDVKLRILLEAVPPQPRLGQLIVFGINALKILGDVVLLVPLVVFSCFFCLENWHIWGLLQGFLVLSFQISIL